MDEGARKRWVDRLTRMAEPVAGASPPRLPGGAGEAFRLAVMQAQRAAPEPVPRGDAGLWWALVDPGAESALGSLIDVDGEGPLLAVDQFLAIEVWTESELCALHALFDLGISRKVQVWMERAGRAAAWHLVHTQPDHATARPWAIHGFLLQSTSEATTYAEMLLHNALAMTGEPDINSAWVMLDAARHLAKRQSVEQSTGRNEGFDPR
jgi:hypothetical protein